MDATYVCYVMDVDAGACHSMDVHDVFAGRERVVDIVDAV